MAQIVEVEVSDIRAGGVLVKILKDGRIGFIRRRELSWERRITFRPNLPHVGERFEAKIINEGENGHYPQLSLCQLTDPWKDAKNKYAVNDIVRGEVVNIRDFGVFVQPEPGIDAVIWPRYLPMLRDQVPHDILAVGDQVQGVLLNIDWSKRQMELSITHRLEQISRVTQDGKLPQIEVFREKLNEWGETTVKSSTSKFGINSTVSPRYHPPLPKLKQVLIVDDNPRDRQYIMRAIIHEHELVVGGASNSKKALEKLTKGTDYDLVIIDLTLKRDNGVDVAEKLLDHRPDLDILFTSNDPLVERKRLVIRGRKYPFVHKEREDLIAWIDNLYGGYWEEIDQKDDMSQEGNGSFLQQLGMTAVARRPLTEVLTELLARLREETGVTYAIVLEVDEAKGSVAVIASAPLLEDELLYGIDALYYSPVQDVVENNVTDYRQYIPSERPNSLKNFFPLLEYQTYLGIPLNISGMRTRHALLLLDEYRPVISDEVKERAYLTTQFIRMALERNLLLDFMHRYEQRYTLGQLLGSLVHELTNKLDTLAATDNLATILQRAGKADGVDEQQQWLQHGQETAVRLVRAKQDLQELVLSYSRLASGHFEPVDVNETILKIVRQMTKKANEVHVWLRFIPFSGLPPARAVQPRLEQVITNLLLNAIQQIDRKRHQMAEIAHERGKMPLCQQGIISIQTRYRKAAVYPIEIIIMDSGPGVSAHRQEEIFLLDTSGREAGHGLGLYISRSLMETMGGQLSLVDSVSFLGTAFIITLSEFSVEEPE